MAGDPYFTSVQLLLHGDGANAGTTFTDSSRAARTLTASGNVQTSTAQFKYGTASILFDGSGDRLSVSNSVFALGTGDFTIEFWGYLNSASGGNFLRYIAIGNDAVAGSLYFLRSGTTNPARIYLEGYQSSAYFSIITAPVTTIANSSWKHIALTRSGNTWTIWVDGASYATGTSSYSVTQSTLYIGGNNLNTLNYAGYMDDVRVTVGVARYTAPFTPDTSAFPNNWQASDTLTDGTGLAEQSYLGLLNEDDVTESVTFDPDSNLGYVRSVTDPVSLGPVLDARFGWHLADTFRSTDFLAVNRRANITATDTIGTAEVLKYDYGTLVTETLLLLDALSGPTKYRLSVSDLTRLADQVVTAFPMLLTQGIGVAEVTKAFYGVLAVEQLGLQDVISSRAIYKLSVVDRVNLSDLLRRFFAGDVVEAMSFGDVLVVRPRFGRALTETVGVAETLTPRMVFRLIEDDTLGLSDTRALKMIFRGALTDGVDLSALYVSPNGGVTTWAINTKTGAVTEYNNYEFNSFARAGFKYLGASSNGLYELDGDDDAGDDIVSVIKSGLAQFGGSRFTAFKAAYLGIRGEGDFYLRLETGRGEFYNYKFLSQDMNTTKVQMGKGLRARYFSFQLTSTGQDFDLESIEFVPLVAQRRV